VSTKYECSMHYFIYGPQLILNGEAAEIASLSCGKTHWLAKSSR
jgi:hypothetical protein